MRDDSEDPEKDPLVRVAAMVADGEFVDWAAEAERTPDLEPEMRGLRWVEAITIAREVAVRKQAGPSRSVRRTASARDAPREAASNSADAAPQLAPGARWGRLEVIERIGHGQAGDVYRAFDSELGRTVALKIWRERAGYRTTGTEARRLGRVRHPVVLTVLGHERHDGLAGMWTDFLDGSSLEQRLQAHGPVGVEEACRIGIALCEALEAIHAAGMVHRDIKASNVMQLADGSVVLIDFSSVKELPRGVPENTAHLRGTPLATAPELLRGEPVGPSADIYSMGTLLYRLITGAYPFDASTFAELVEKVERRSRVPLSTRCPDCDPGFVELVERALADNPADRPAGAAAMREALDAVLATM